jgi:hypothetical protein
MDISLLTAPALALLLAVNSPAQSLSTGQTRFPLPVSSRPIGVQPAGIEPQGVRPTGVAVGSQPPPVLNANPILPSPPVIQTPAIDPPPAIPEPAANNLPDTMTATAPVLNVTNVAIPRSTYEQPQ